MKLSADEATERNRLKFETIAAQGEAKLLREQCESYRSTIENAIRVLDMTSDPKARGALNVLEVGMHGKNGIGRSMPEHNEYTQWSRTGRI